MATKLTLFEVPVELSGNLFKVPTDDNLESALINWASYQFIGPHEGEPERALAARAEALLGAVVVSYTEPKGATNDEVY